MFYLYESGERAETCKTIIQDIKDYDRKKRQYDNS